MKFSTLSILSGLAVSAFAAPAPPTHVVHEKREHQLNKWSRRDVKLNRDAVIPMSIGLTQSNLDQGYEFLMDVSHPESKNYGKHWSMQKVAFAFQATLNLVLIKVDQGYFCSFRGRYRSCQIMAYRKRY